MQVQCEIKSSATGGTSWMSEAHWNDSSWSEAQRRASVASPCGSIREYCVLSATASLEVGFTWGILRLPTKQFNHLCLYVPPLLSFVFEYGNIIKQWRVEIYTSTWKTFSDAFFANFVRRCSWCVDTVDKYLLLKRKNNRNYDIYGFDDAVVFVWNVITCSLVGGYRRWRKRVSPKCQ